MKYKVGDKVVVRPDLNKRELYKSADNRACVHAIESMLNFAGKEVVIRSLNTNSSSYKIFGDIWHWVDGMFCDTDIVIDVGELI